jgi:hypothetical protein
VRRTLVALAVVVALIVVVELVAPSWVATRAETAVAEATSERVEVAVDVSGPPLVVPVLVGRPVRSWAVALTSVDGRRVPLEVLVELEDVQLDRGRLLRGDVRVTAVDRATATVTVDLSETVPEVLQPMADRLAEVGLERLLDVVGDGLVLLRDGALVLGGIVLPLVVPSCTVDADAAVVVTTCEVAEVPPEFLALFDGAPTT